MLAATVRVTRDLDLAEEAVQDAYVQALTAWRDGAPRNPGAWLTTVARRNALNALRRQATLQRKLPLLLGGIYILEARDLDHALECAAMTPIVDGGVEVRPLVDFQVV